MTIRLQAKENTELIDSNAEIQSTFLINMLRLRKIHHQHHVLILRLDQEFVFVDPIT